MAEYLFYTDIVFWGIFLAIAIPYLSFHLAIKLRKIKTKPDYEKWIMSIGFALGAFIGFITIPNVDLLNRLTVGALIYGSMFLISRSIADYFLFKLMDFEKTGIPITKIKIEKDYLKLLKDSDIYTIEQILDEDSKRISENTGLSVETVIYIREKARKILKNKKVRK